MRWIKPLYAKRISVLNALSIKKSYNSWTYFSPEIPVLNKRKIIMENDSFASTLVHV